ncbi:TPA: hypothetical protein IAC10_03685 [Candidatus Scatousia excrementigallinarum]|uniref:Uncharacterized protein n=1 Tax=Candidatus Scatousia excrementigallinarum TaxID=2840935 RepID=A0A9D1JM70_9BACT|nr:hypothetical protein [Candidatus Scatousia excrementigallinarum]
MNTVNKLLTALGHNTTLHFDKWTQEHEYVSGKKKWIANILPENLLKRTVKHAVESLVTLCECDEFFKEFPDNIKSPDYGDKWGRLANYIEINNRAIAEMHGNLTKNGILSAIKLLPAIPPSAKSWANCVILSQIFPNIFGDGYNKGPFEENSIYGIKLNAGYSGNIIDWSITGKISPEEQFTAFNDLAHFHGLKTGFRTVISADQIKVCYPDREEGFNWCNPEHQEMFINEHVKLMKLGFECIFIDSAKHIGGYECENYTGVGDLPEYGQMQYILQQIRERSGMTTLSFVGEKSTGDFERYRNLGLTSGTAFVNPDDFENVKQWSEKFKYSREYAPGIEVSNDNDNGGSRYEDRLNRINTCLFGYEYPSDKLPSFMQMEDIFPLRYDTSTHHLMMTNPSYSTDRTPESHWENLFTKDDGRAYNARVGELFANALNL